MKIQFIDIETVPVYENYESLPDDGKAAFKRKFERSGKLQELLKEKYIGGNVDVALAALYHDEAGFMAEFSEVVCLSSGIFHDVNQAGSTIKNRVGHLKSFIGTEAEILNNWVESLNKFDKSITGDQLLLCAHNGKNFDFPFLMKRFMMNRIKLPPILKIAGKKPWEVPLQDTMEMWRGTDVKNYTSLVLLCYALGIPSPKSDIDGSMVAAEYRAGNIDRIAKYCMQDVKTMMQCWLRMNELPDVETYTEHPVTA